MIYTKLLTLCLLAFAAWPASTGPVPFIDFDFDDLAGITDYLKKFGYLNETIRLTPFNVIEAIKVFQTSAGLKPSGIVDLQTQTLLFSPRCGTKNFINRFAISNSGWTHKNLTYRVDQYPDPRELSKTDVDQTMALAVKFWGDVTTLTFQEKKSGTVDIVIIFSPGAHGDTYDFDGPGGTLAHAFEPFTGTGTVDSIYGDAHFDDSETWTINTDQGTNLLQVAVHELGHSLGLSHSKEKESVMYPYFGGYDEDFALQNDDIAGIQAIYGAPQGQSSLMPLKSTTLHSITRPPTRVTRDTGKNGNVTPTTSRSSTTTTTASGSASTTNEDPRRFTSTRRTPREPSTTTEDPRRFTSTSRTPREPSGCAGTDFVKMSGVKRRGGRIIKAIKTLRRCKTKCERNATCWAFSFKQSTRRQEAKCFLHTLRTTYNNALDFYFKRFNVDRTPFYEEAPFTSQRGGLRVQDLVSQEECEDMCDNEEHCVAYTYKRKLNGKAKWWCKLHIYAISTGKSKGKGKGRGNNNIDHYVKLGC